MPAHEASGEATCGHELARDAEVPELLGQLMEHVAVNMVEHARWVRASGDAGLAEERGLLEIADRYRSIARSAESAAAAAMRSMREVPAAAHDPELLDRTALAGWMTTKIQLQRGLAQMLLRHADDSEAVLRKLEHSVSEAPEE